jgi:hypothetical protein
MATVPSIDGQLTTLLISLKSTCILADLESFVVSGCDKTMSTSKNRLCNSSISDKSSSLKLSMRASRSRSTLVGYDDELEYKLDTAHGTTTKIKKLTWPDHLLGVFCIKRGSRVSSTMITMPIRPEEDQVCYLTATRREAVSDQNYRETSPLHGSYLSTFFRDRRTSRDISYRRKPNAPLIPEIFKGIWYPERLLPMFLGILSPISNH